MKNLIATFCLVLFLIHDLRAEIPAELNEKFDPSLARLDNLAKLEAYIDSLVKVKGILPHTEEEVMLVNSVIEERFYHDNYSRYSLSENWISFTAGNLFWWHLNAIVMTDDLLKYPMAACSQQAIVLRRVLKNKGYKVRKLGLQGHFVLEAFYDGNWHLFDPNKETSFQGLPHDEIQKKFNNGRATVPYVSYMDAESTQKMFSIMEIGEENEYPAIKARWFHRITKVLSVLIPVIVFLLPFYFYENRKTKKANSAKNRDKVLIA